MSVPNNILGLLEINPAYVEAFLVGLNHEMSRELRWREYPAALGQTWFQHFFDNVDPPGSVDVAPIDSWIASGPLGLEFGGGKPPGLVVLIKADLIRKYPDVRVYAVPAELNEDGERVPVEGGDIAGAELRRDAATRRQLLRLRRRSTEEEARGDGDGRRGMVLRARGGAPGDALRSRPRSTARVTLPRSGTTWRGRTSPLRTAWCRGSARSTPPNPEFADADLGGLEWGDDAAVMAAITFRRPIQVYMHASAMLPGGSSD